jgi:hypothetical protein
MKLSNLFMIALLAGTLGAFGCSDDNGGAAGTGGSGTAGTGGTGTGGSGGTATDPCTGGFCEDPSEAKKGCEVAIEYCKSDDCCSGAGGAGGDGGAVDPTDAECDAIGPKICMLDFGGGGGTGGGGTGGGGTGGGGGGDNPTADEVCALCDSEVPGHIQDCKDTYNACLSNPPSGGDPGEKCSVIALAQCGAA